VAIVDDRMQDSTKILVSDLPIRFDSTDVLLHTVGLVEFKRRGKYSKYSSTSYSSSDIASNYFKSDNFRGDFINIIFEDSSGRRLLTKNKITIKGGVFLRQLYDLTKQAYLLYVVYDRDTNGDSKLNSEDIESLYISKLNGTELTKITPELHEFYDYRMLKGDNGLYYRTLEDVNEDGELTTQDRFHYFYLEFRKEGYSKKEYYPLDIIKDLHDQIHP
jgi:hypothetical protein